jgi:cytoskeletal protein CcmA (bactofilin family)
MTTIGPSLLITGDVTSQEDVTLHGTIKGHITVERGVLHVAETGRVYADVRGPSVTIEGTLDGTVTGASRVELTSSANVTGILTGPTIVLRDGATFNGMIDMDRQAKGQNPAGLKIVAPRTTAQVVTRDAPESAPVKERAWGT